MNKNKTIIEELVRLHEKTISTTESTTEILKIMADTMDKIVDRLIFLFRLSQIFIFILTLIFWKLFLLEPFNKFLSTFIKWWPNLSEAWQIFIVSIPILIIIQVAGSLIVNKLIGEKK